MSLVLASSSVARALILRNAGLEIDVVKPAVDEAAVKASYLVDNADINDVAIALAEMKAQSVSRRKSGSYVLGADQMLQCNGVWFDKPIDLADARAQLKILRGQSHQLISATVLVKDGERLWHHVDHAELFMRDFSDAFLDQYLVKMDDIVLSSVGGYQLEGLGAQLIKKIHGDFFTVLGLPLLPVLAILRSHGLLQS